MLALGTAVIKIPSSESDTEKSSDEKQKAAAGSTWMSVASAVVDRITVAVRVKNMTVSLDLDKKYYLLIMHNRRHASEVVFAEYGCLFRLFWANVSGV